MGDHSPSTTTPPTKHTTTVTTMSKPNPTIQKSLHRISIHPTLTPYRRRVYRVLLSVPKGRWTTYAAMAHYLGSSPRAVGNAMRTNPFAPEVPCHRVLAKDGSLGGFKGEWERAVKGRGKGAGNGTGRGVPRSRQEKIQLLLDEGVVFDEEQRATGGCFLEFVELGI